MISAVIFDLDSCLCAANEVGDQLFAPAFDAILRANDGSVSEATLSAAFSDCWRCAFDFVAEKHGFTAAMTAAGWEAFARTEVNEPMHGYGDLQALAGMPVQRFLVTSGFRRLQQSKIAALGFAHLFAAIHIDAIDEPDRRGKQWFFEKILADFHLARAATLIVGDNPDSEIAAGNRMGLRTVQILRPGVPRTDQAAHHIRDLAGLKPLLSL